MEHARERVRAEEALRTARAELARAGRLLLIEELAASLAHELNQPLAALLTNAQAGLRWLDRSVPDLHETRAALARIVEDVQRASAVIERLRARPNEPESGRVWFDMNDAIREAAALCREELAASGTSLNTELAPGLPEVHGDRRRIQEVLFSLIRNADEAMNGSASPRRELSIRSLLAQPPQLVVQVHDTGPGVPEESLPHVFERFYSTKRRAIGLGLSVARSIVEAHGGTLGAGSGAGFGAVFEFRLPLPSVR